MRLKALFICLAMTSLAHAGFSQEVDLLTYTLPSYRFATVGYGVRCEDQNKIPTPGYCHWTNENVPSRTYPTGDNTYTLVKSYYSGSPWEDYRAMGNAIRLLTDWAAPGENTLYPYPGVKWLPRYLGHFDSASWHDDLWTCHNSLSCTGCTGSYDFEVRGDTTAYFVLRLWSQAITPNGPEYILTRHNYWLDRHEIYYYGPNKGWLGWDDYQYVPAGCPGGAYWTGDPYFPADTHLCLRQRSYVTDLVPDVPVNKNCN